MLVLEHRVCNISTYQQYDKWLLYKNYSCEDEITLTDISGDMNHVYRVYVTCASSSDHPEKTQKEPCPKKKGYSVIVKMAPVDVLVSPGL